MTQKNLEKELLKLAKAVTKDDRWDNNDSFHATIFGIILFGYGLGFGRNILFLDLKSRYHENTLRVTISIQMVRIILLLLSRDNDRYW